MNPSTNLPAYASIRTIAYARLGTGIVFSLMFHALLVSLQFGIPGIGLPGLELPWHERRAQAFELNLRLTPIQPFQPTHIAPARLAEMEPQPRPPIANPVAAPKRPPLPNRPSAETALEVVQPAETAKPAPTPTEESIDIGTMPTITHRQIPATPQPPVLSMLTHTPEHTSSFTLPPPAPDEQNEQTAHKEGTPEQPADATAPKPSDDAAEQSKEQALTAQKLANQEQARRTLDIEAKQQEEINAKEHRSEEPALSKQAEQGERQQADALALPKPVTLQHPQEEKPIQELALPQKMQEPAAPPPHEQERIATYRTRAMEKHLFSSVSGNALAQLQSIQLNRQPDALPNTQLAQPAQSAQPMPADEQSAPPASADSARRQSVFGRIERDIGLAMYVESWRLKIERNGSLNYTQAAKEMAHNDPIVTVAIRSDGSIEGIVIHRSSGQHKLDEAVRRIARLNARYSAFPPELARRYDVIEIRRIWRFEDKLRILEEVY